MLTGCRCRATMCSYTSATLQQAAALCVYVPVCVCVCVVAPPLRAGNVRSAAGQPCGRGAPRDAVSVPSAVPAPLPAFPSRRITGIGERMCGALRGPSTRSSHRTRAHCRGVHLHCSLRAAWPLARAYSWRVLSPLVRRATCSACAISLLIDGWVKFNSVAGQAGPVPRRHRGSVRGGHGGS